MIKLWKMRTYNSIRKHRIISKSFWKNNKIKDGFLSNAHYFRRILFLGLLWSLSKEFFLVHYFCTKRDTESKIKFGIVLPDFFISFSKISFYPLNALSNKVLTFLNYLAYNYKGHAKEKNVFLNRNLISVKNVH